MKKKSEKAPHVFTIEEREALAHREQKLYKILGIITLVIGFAGGVPAVVLLAKSDAGTSSVPTWIGYIVLLGALAIVFIGSALISKVQRISRRLAFEKNDIQLQSAAPGHEYYYVRCVSDRFDALYVDRTLGTFGVRTGKDIIWSAPIDSYASYSIWENGEERTDKILATHPIGIGDTSDGVKMVIHFKDDQDKEIILTTEEQIVPMAHSAYQVILTELRDLLSLIKVIAEKPDTTTSPTDDATPEITPDATPEA